MSTDRHPTSPKSLSKIRRAAVAFPILTAFILLCGPSPLISPMWWQQSAAEALPELLPTMGLGVALGVLGSYDIWNMKSRRHPLWKDILYGTIGLSPLIAAIFLRETGMWRWSFLNGDTFFVSLLLTIEAILLITERRRSVRIYLTGRCLEFVHEKPDA